MKILVVDREEELGAVLEVLKHSHGNEVQSARDGDEALALAEGQHVDLLITEAMMEPMNGFTLRNKMENRHPEVRTIFMSAYDLGPYAEYTAGNEVVTKPATQEKLFPAITRALGFGDEAPAAPAAPEEPEEPEAAPAAFQATQMALPSFPLPPSAGELFIPPMNLAPAAPRATPAPGAVPRATPRAVPKVTSAPMARPVATPRATPAQAAAPVAVPRATPAARPVATNAGAPVAKAVATPRATPAAAAAPRATPVAAAPAPADPLQGRTLGNYRVERRLGMGKWGPVYMAIQTSMNRPVAMELLSQEMAGDETARQNFVATARAKAAVQYPHILAVYEADQAEGHYFYTHEYVDGLTLAQLLARGEGLSEPTALQTIKYVSQGLAHLHHQRITHSIPDATDIYLGQDGLPRLSNVALPGEEMPVPQEEIQMLAATVRSMLPGGQARDRGLQAMLMRMAVGTQAGFQSWPALFQAIQAIEPKVVPADAFKLSAQDEAAIRAVEAARKKQKRQVVFSLVSLVVFLCAVAVLVWWQFMRPETRIHDYSDDMVPIPGGPFTYQDGQEVTLPTFYIDRYEVTMAEYAKFLEALAKAPDPTVYDSPIQPKDMLHVPPDWNIYYGRAKSSISAYRTVRGVPITLDCPVFNVNFFDAYAYAKWKGRRLPTEQEWEKAARGTSGNIYPWGNTWDPTKLNAGGDYQQYPQAGYKPTVDGYTWWAPVDAIQNDRSPFGVIGMGGNVSEWTNTWDASKTYPVIRGGNFKSDAEAAKTTVAIRDALPYTAKENLGFRTAADKQPEK